MLWKLQHFSAHLHRFDCCQHAKTEFDLQPRQNAFCLIECVRQASCACLCVWVRVCVWATGGVIEWVQASVIYIQLTVACASRTAIYLICIFGMLEIQMLALDVMTLAPHKYSSQSDHLYHMSGCYNETRHSMFTSSSRGNPNKCVLGNYGIKQGVGKLNSQREEIIYHTIQ